MKWFSQIIFMSRTKVSKSHNGFLSRRSWIFVDFRSNEWAIIPWDCLLDGTVEGRKTKKKNILNRMPSYEYIGKQFADARLLRWSRHCFNRQQKWLGTSSCDKWSESSRSCSKIQSTIRWDKCIDGTKCSTFHWYFAGNGHDEVIRIS